MSSVKLHSAVEMPVELWSDNKIIATFMCSPYDLEDLAIGHMLTRGMIHDIDNISEITVSEKTNQVFIKTKTPLEKQNYSVPEFILSGTSSVNKFTDNIYKIPSVEGDFSVELSRIIDATQYMVDNALIYQTTGGVHSAILCTSSGSKYYLREDIGRHCAVDKVVGAAAKDGVDFSKSFVCTSGRISLDMLLKSASVGLPIVGSLKYPTDMGVHLAEHYKISIVAQLLTKKPLVYSRKERII